MRAQPAKLFLIIVFLILTAAMTTACGRAQKTSDAKAATATPFVSTLAGRAGSMADTNGRGATARFRLPEGIACDAAGTVYVADDETLRKISDAGVVTTLAGRAGAQGSADGTALTARFNNPDGIVCDRFGNLYVVDTGGDTIRKITPAGVVTTLAGKANIVGSADGRGRAARFDGPSYIACDAAGNLYVTDFFNCTIRRITPAGVVTTLAGKAGSAGTADGRGAKARFYDLQGIACDRAGNLYVADSKYNTIRKITPAGVVSTLAGFSDRRGGYADGTGTAARFDQPEGVACDAAGNIFVADSSNQTIRKVTPEGVVTTVAGQAPVRGSADGSGTVARFFYPWAVACDSAGNVYVADLSNHTIRKISWSR